MTRQGSPRFWARAAASVLFSAGTLMGSSRLTLAATCTGDCNGDGKVRAGEVTTIIARILSCGGRATGACGIIPAPDCANADRNGDGTITAGEATRAIANALLGCPTSETLTPSPSLTTTPSPTNAPTEVATTAVAPTATETPTVTATVDVPTPTATSTRTPTRTLTPTSTATRTPTATPQLTATPTPTATPVASPTPRPAVCNNGVLENGETCAKCAKDCKVASCTPTSTVATFFVTFTPPLGENASSVTALVGYRSSVVSIPGKGTGSCKGGSNDGKACSGGADCTGGQCLQPKSRVKNTPPASFIGANDLDYALRVVVTRSSQIAAGRLFSVDFDTCQGGPAPTLADFGCTVEGCASSFGPIDGCTCTVVTP